jgi:hypothetical protein
MPKGKPTAKWLRLTEEQNALDYLEKAHRAIQRVDAIPTEWKWVVIGLHNALYSFGICALKGSNWELVTLKTKRGNRLIGFDETVKRVQSSSHMGFYTYSKPVVLSSPQKDAIRWFKKYRDYFEHYIPLSWSILKQDLPLFSIEILDVLRLLVLDTGNVHLTEHQCSQVSGWLKRDKQLLQRSQLYKDYLSAIKRRRSKKKKSK